MYRIVKDGSVLSTEDKARYVRLLDNGTYALCSEGEADGVVVNNDYVCSLERGAPLPGLDTVSVVEFDGVAHLNAAVTEGAKLAQEAAAAPGATVGILSDGFEAWKPGATYEKQYTLFTHDGKVGFTKLPNITAQAHQPPFSTGMEAVYGVRPVPNELGIYAYTYGMAASCGMRVQEGDNVYSCIQSIETVLWPPSQLPGFFAEE